MEENKARMTKADVQRQEWVKAMQNMSVKETGVVTDVDVID